MPDKDSEMSNNAEKMVNNFLKNGISPSLIEPSEKEGVMRVAYLALYDQEGLEYLLENNSMLEFSYAQIYRNSSDDLRPYVISSSANCTYSQLRPYLKKYNIVPGFDAERRFKFKVLEGVS